MFNRPPTHGIPDSPKRCGQDDAEGRQQTFVSQEAPGEDGGLSFYAGTDQDGCKTEV